MADLAERIISHLQWDPRVRSVTLTGSRARGNATPLSDWDFDLDVDDAEAFERDLPVLVEQLGPLAHGWDPFGVRHNYMVMLPGPAKVDLIIEIPQEESAPWRVTAETLPQIEHHFWDWTLWLGSKTLHGNHELVRNELAKMSERLLGPLGARDRVTTIGDAVVAFGAARNVAERRLALEVDRRIEREVLPALKRAGVL
jgi:hypothetical protein